MDARTRLALAALSGASALGLARVFGGRAWILPVLGAAVLPHLLVAATAGRRSGSAAAAAIAVVVGGGLWTVGTALTEHTSLGVPRTSAAGALAEALREAPEVLRSAVVPVPPEGAALVLAVVAVWTVAALSEWFAAAVPGSLVALVPSFVLLVVVAALGKGGSVLAAAAYTGAAGALLLAHGRRRAPRHALVTDQVTRRRWPITGGAALVACAVVVGVVVAPRLPGAESPPLVDYRDLGDGRGAVLELPNPLVDIRANLVRRDGRPVFRVEVDAEHERDRAFRWRLYALDDFDGDVWDFGSRARSVDGDLVPSGPGAVPGSGSRLVEQRFVLSDPSATFGYVPSLYRPVSVTGTSATMAIPESGSVFVEQGADEAPREFLVRSQTPVLAEADLDAARVVDPPAALLALPPDLPPSVAAEARRIARGRPNPYRQLLALQEHLRTFSYTLEIPDGGGSTTALERFLFEDRAGFCVQFATAFATMARVLGIPARVAVGYTEGTSSAPGRYSVTSDEMHAWPEVWLGPDVGWVVDFEPTPAFPGVAPGVPDAEDPGDEPLEPVPTPTTSSPVTAPATTVPAAAGPEVATPRAAPDRSTRVVVAVALGALVVLVALGSAPSLATVAGKVRRRRRRRAAPDRRSLVHGAWDEALDRLAEADVHDRPSATPLEFARRVAPAAGAGAAGEPLIDLARLETEARWSPLPPSAATAARAWDTVAELERALLDPLPRAARWRRRLRSVPGASERAGHRPVGGRRARA